MFNNQIIDVAIGLVFVYLLLSLICSALNELIETALKKRAIDLERGIRELLVPGSASGTPDLVKEIYNHPLVNNLFGKRYEDSRIGSKVRYVWRTKLPSYIPSRSFALALMDAILPAQPTSPSGTAGAAPAKFEVKLDAIPPAPPSAIAPENPLQPLRGAVTNTPLLNSAPQAQAALLGLIDAAGNDVAQARQNIEDWYNASMDRVAGWYKRRVQLCLLIIGLLAAVLMNADSVAIVRALNSDRNLREVVVAQAIKFADEAAKPTPTPAGSNSAKPVPDHTSTPASTPASNSTPKPTPTATTLPISLAARFNHAVTATQTPTLSASPSAVPMSSIAETGKSEAKPSATASPSPYETANPTPITASPTTSTTSNFEGFGLKVSGPVWLVLFVVVLGVCLTLFFAAKARNKVNEVRADTAKWIAILLAGAFLFLFIGSWLFGGSKPQATQAVPSPSQPTLGSQQNANSPPKQTLETATNPITPAPTSTGSPLASSNPTPECPPACKDGRDKDSAECRLQVNKCQLQDLGLPIGWSSTDDARRKMPESWSDVSNQIRWHLFGWLLTAIAISLGAPFWFDLLNKFIVIRGTVKPREKSPDEKSKD